ncbi:proline--tRNA ligase [Ammonifex thiophilus]|uniref:Proline--tRNA ligase n=1 Tax=Ammonifex thiophilus TaxID=444093 RepID=A0A3D8P3V0_9THEO|nr:proline--tRNA ligase [Ammonifex thiophilus]RDV82474.1 proline--tRNA ligase [Ammonifex thiophilus]
MRLSTWLVPTLREVPAEAEVASHRLLLRAGFIRKVAAGIYTLLPLGKRVCSKIENIVREEMNRAGGQEILMPILQPAELWHRSGRWEVYGPELFRLKDRHGRDFCLGPTHEEMITALVAAEVRSYKQLPLLLYQIGNKYRDERRPRFGLLRGREFIMKDLYSFDRDWAGLEESYRKMYEAYTRIFTRVGLNFRAVEADTGAIGGSVSHEFMALAEAGEAVVVYCPDTTCGYAANVEKAESLSSLEEIGEEGPIELVVTPGVRSAEEVAAFLGLPVKQIIKTLIYRTEKGLVAALVRGDREVNEVKLQNHLGVLELELAGEDLVEEATGAPPGFAGPIGLSLPLVVDREVLHVKAGAVGANRPDAHYINVLPGRDFPVQDVADIRQVSEGDPCPRCGRPLLSVRGIEVGQIFQLGDKYSRALNAYYLDERGEKRPIIMGCYGIGITRTMAAVVEQHHDEEGIIWPVAVAPFQVLVLPVNYEEAPQRELAEEIYNLLREKGIEVLLDDREERPGVKFKDADLVGYPLRITVGRHAAEGKVELKLRRTGENWLVSKGEVLEKVTAFLEGKEFCTG